MAKLGISTVITTVLPVVCLSGKIYAKYNNQIRPIRTVTELMRFSKAMVDTGNGNTTAEFASHFCILRGGVSYEIPDAVQLEMDKFRRSTDINETISATDALNAIKAWKLLYWLRSAVTYSALNAESQAVSATKKFA